MTSGTKHLRNSSVRLHQQEISKQALMAATLSLGQRINPQRREIFFRISYHCINKNDLALAFPTLKSEAKKQLQWAPTSCASDVF